MFRIEIAYALIAAILAGAIVTLLLLRRSRRRARKEADRGIAVSVVDDRSGRPRD